MKKFLALLLCLTMVFTLAACGGGNQTPAGSGSAAPVSGEEGSIPGVKKDLIVGSAQDINQLNPLLQNDQINNNCFALTHQRLVSLDNVTNEKNPSLASSWEWTDDNHLVFHLVENATFSTGEPLTADDVVFTFEMAMSDDPEVSRVSGNFKQVVSVEALDPYTVQVTTTQYSNEIIDVFMGCPLSIQSKAAWEDESNKEPWLVGSGQYKFDSWVEGQYSKWVRNENYWGDDPGMADEIIFKPMLEAAQRVIALQNGEIDVCIDPPATQLEYLESDPNLTLHTQAGTRLFYMGFNCSKAPFDNKTLRQAVACAIDKEGIIQIVLGGRGKSQTTVLNRGMWSFLDNDEVEGGYTYDVDRAKELLAQAGYEPGQLSVDLYAATTDPYKTIAPIIQANLKEIGIEVNTHGGSWDDLYPHEFSDPITWGWGSNSPSDVYELSHSSGTMNYSCYSDATVDAYLDEALAADDVEASYPLWQQSEWDGVGGIAPAGDATWVWLANVSHLYWKRDGLTVARQKLQPHGHGWSVLNNVDRWSWQ